MTHAQTENNKCTTCSSPGSDKLNVYDWLSGMHMPTQSRFVEVKFKNTRKDYYLNDSGLSLYPGEVVVVDGIRGFDIGIVSLVGELVPFQMKRKNIKPDHESIKKLLRKPNQEELDRWTSMRNKEYDTMLESRKFAEELRLNMKISDVEYQADKSFEQMIREEALRLKYNDFKRQNAIQPDEVYQKKAKETLLNTRSFTVRPVDKREHYIKR